ncbi:putative N(4)-(beta-N-acetylglucosaminyl)-L-asparaginase GD10667 [Drosophila sulfurigaster albostrigata]|uniref:putative N(4)-(beta-N-acetylglucosaminyl)-L-asparaginase GD10667 n=1 Tax=Drosophila sulfurigaster albostrigata TaxID=89887 RepID=UPI002D21B99D|nr:putative N(4)-(beta-N-acetylglucosaminyl)-L-asparaginase GD10667 [Drosophila sulfurigaster albostrigata]
MLRLFIGLLCWAAITTVASSSSSGRGFTYRKNSNLTASPAHKINSNPNYVVVATTKPSKKSQLLPMVINTWNFTDANAFAWRILQQSEGGLGQTRNAVVEGCNKCEQLQCDHAVGGGGSPDELGDTTLDALVMDGATMNVGAVAGLQGIKDAIQVARHVMERTSHTLLVGNSASEFAKSMGFRPESLVTPYSKLMWQNWKDGNCQPNFWHDVHPDPKVSCGPYKPQATPITSFKEDQARTEYQMDYKNHDTIGMIAVDVQQQIHVGTSTNGLNFKIPGRVGDSPIPGAGGYADNEAGAAVATGDGDIMMRFLPTFLAVEAMRSGKTPAQAAEASIQRILKHYKDFWGAVIAVNRLGEYAVACHGMSEFPFVVSNPLQGTQVETVKCLAQ